MNWAIHQYDGIAANDVIARNNRQHLLDAILSLSWFDIENNDLSRFTERYWFMSLPLWLNMQREINEFNMNEEERQQRRQQRQQHRRQMQRQRYRERRRRLRELQQQQAEPVPVNECQPQNHQQKRKPKPKPNADANQPPKVRNLTVIPICSFQRKHVAIDNYTLYRIYCDPDPADQAEKEEEKEEETNTTRTRGPLYHGF